LDPEQIGLDRNDPPQPPQQVHRVLVDLHLQFGRDKIALATRRTASPRCDNFHESIVAGYDARTEVERELVLWLASLFDEVGPGAVHIFEEWQLELCG
jgi:hypothetical protein